MKIRIEIIPNNQQRYNTVGDWQWLKEEEGVDSLRIRVSDMNKTGAKGSILIAIHELIEVFLCQANGITESAVDKFDLNYKGDDEPGDDPKAPYKREHCIATGVERILAAEMGIDWKTYEDEIVKMTEEYDERSR